jgi:16S rRNA (guanine1207-N2)-methyltransferase
MRSTPPTTSPAPVLPHPTEARPDSRDDDAIEVLLGCMPPLAGNTKILVVDDPAGRLEDELGGRGALATPWRRVATGKRKATAWPAAGPYAAATLRMPRSKEVLDFALEAIAAQLEPGAPVWIYGANDEGIKSVGKRLEARWEAVVTVEARKHCRVWEARRPAAWTNPRDLASFARTETLPLPWGALEHVVYPGVFAKGGLDEATALLLEALPEPEPAAHVLDFACGPGTIAAALKLRQPGLSLQLLDADALAVTAARANLPGTLVACGDSWGALPAYQRYDLIVSNPPIHQGKARDYTVITRLIEGAPARLLPKGCLVLVVQAQVPAAALLNEHFDLVELIAEDGRFKVWRAGRLRDRYPTVSDPAEDEAVVPRRQGRRAAEREAAKLAARGRPKPTRR